MPYDLYRATLREDIPEESVNIEDILADTEMYFSQNNTFDRFNAKPK